MGEEKDEVIRDLFVIDDGEGKIIIVSRDYMVCS